jgi:hypothetical protein
MRSLSTLRLATAAGLLGLAACSNDSTSPASLVDQTTLTTDVASSAGDAVALDVYTLSTNEGFAGLTAPIAMAPAAVTGDSIVYSRTRTCYDSTGTSTACGTSAVRTAVLHVTFAGFRTDTAENGAIFTGDVTRTSLDTLFRKYTSGVETSRVHDGVSTGSDTSSFVGPNVTRTYQEAGSDSVEAVTYNLPRINNPWPVSGKVVRNVSLHATFSNATRSSTTTVTKRIEVDFPPDNQGNVVLKIDSQTCNLNLVTHHVSNCH